MEKKERKSQRSVSFKSLLASWAVYACRRGRTPRKEEDEGSRAKEIKCTDAQGMLDFSLKCY